MGNIWNWIKTHIDLKKINLQKLNLQNLNLQKLNLKDLIYWLIIGVFVFILSCSVRTCQNNSDRYDNNLHALTDSIAYYQSENGALIASKTAFESNIKELKRANGELYSELQDMKLKMKNVASAIHTEGEINFGQRDTVYQVIRDTLTNSFKQDFDFSNQWRVLNGQIDYRNDSLSIGIKTDKVIFDYTIAMDKDNHIYIKSNNPYVTYNELSGFVIPKQKPKHFSFGPSVGIGYGILNRKPDLFVGVTASWKLFEF